MGLFAVFDIGGTSIKYGVVDENGEFLYTSSMDTKAYDGGLCVIGRVIEAVRCIRKENNISGICVSTAGMVCPKEGKIIHAGKTMPNYTGVEVKKLLEDEFGLPCFVENDVNCAALGEFFSGSGKGAHSMICLTVGTGIGGAIVIDGRVMHGFSNSAGEIGYMLINGSHIQDVASASALVKNVAIKKGIEPSSIDGKYVLDKYETGDLVCREEVENLADNLALGISNISYLINPEVVVLGGGIMAKEEVFRPLIEKSLRKYLIEPVYKNTKISFAKLKNTAGMKGAYYNFKERLNK